jgi:hypothetical protein
MAWIRWSRRRPGVRNKSLPDGQSARAAGATQTMPFVATTIRWQSTARRLASQWTVLDGVVFHHEAGPEEAGPEPEATTEIAVRRTLSPDQLLSARIDAAYAVWATARSIKSKANGG